MLPGTMDGVPPAPRGSPDLMEMLESCNSAQKSVYYIMPL